MRVKVSCPAWAPLWLQKQLKEGGHCFLHVQKSKHLRSVKGGEAAGKKCYVFLNQPPAEAKQSCHMLMGHFRKCGSLKQAGRLLRQLSACLSRKCFSERYDYSRLLSKFFCVSSFKQRWRYVWNDSELPQKREGSDIFNSPRRAGEGVVLPVHGGHRECFLKCRGSRGVRHVLCTRSGVFGETALGSLRTAVEVNAFLPACGHALRWTQLDTHSASWKDASSKPGFGPGKGILPRLPREGRTCRAPQGSAAGGLCERLPVDGARRRLAAGSGETLCLLTLLGSREEVMIY